MAFKEMPFVYLLPHEKRLAEVICKSLAALWPEPISITLWGNQDMDPGSSMISRDRNFGLEPNVAGKEMVEKSEEAVDNDLSRSNGEKEGERGYRYRTREEWMEKLPPGTKVFGCKSRIYPSFFVAERERGVGRYAQQYQNG